MPDSIRVTPDNFNRAETDVYFTGQVNDGTFARFLHHREPADVNHQTIVGMNRDTLYSSAVFDLDAGPATIDLPDAKARFMSMQILDQDQYSPLVAYGGRHTLTREGVGPRYVMAAIRTLVDPTDPKDLAQGHALQDAIHVEQE